MQIGCDPEIFAFQNGKLIPAFRFLRSKHRVAALPYGDSVTQSRAYWDGYQAEFRFRSGFICLQEMVGAIQHTLRKMHRQLNRLFPASHFSIDNTIRIPETDLRTVPEAFLAFGCDPSYNAYDLKPENIQDPRDVPWRWAGGHLHFSHLLFADKDAAKERIRHLDAVLGVWAVGAARNYDVPVRRQFYGLPGEYRLPQYDQYELVSVIDNGKFKKVIPRKNGQIPGLEYRTLSNFWLAHPHMVHIIFEIARKALAYGSLWEATTAETIEVIRTMDYDAATKIVERNADWFRCLSDRFSTTKIQKLIAVSTEGMDAHCNPKAFTKNWGLNGFEWGYYDIPHWGE